jgi:hypothetical protein
MNLLTLAQSEEVRVRHQATSAEPQHGDSSFLRRSSRLEALPCPLAAASPLREATESHGKNTAAFLGDFG